MCRRLEELLQNQKKDEAIHTLVSIDRIRGLLETVVLRKKFLKHLASKRQNEGKVTFIFFVLCCTMVHLFSLLFFCDSTRYCY